MSDASVTNAQFAPPVKITANLSTFQADLQEQSGLSVSSHEIYTELTPTYTWHYYGITYPSDATDSYSPSLSDFSATGTQISDFRLLTLDSQSTKDGNITFALGPEVKSIDATTQKVYVLAVKTPTFATGEFNFTFAGRTVDPSLSACGTIASSGTYVLTQSITTASDPCLTIAATTVTVDGTIANNYSIQSTGGRAIFAAGATGFTLENTVLHSTGNGVYFNSFNGTFVNISIPDIAGSAGIFIPGASYVSIINVTFTGWATGNDIQNPSGLLLTGNKVHDVLVTNSSFNNTAANSAGIFLNGDFNLIYGPNTNWTVYNNTFFGNSLNDSGIYITGAVSNSTFTKNSMNFSGEKNTGFLLYNGTEDEPPLSPHPNNLTITNNTVNMTGFGIAIFLNFSDNNTISFNTFIAASNAVNLTNAVNNTFKNNTFTSTGNTTVIIGGPSDGLNNFYYNNFSQSGSGKPLVDHAQGATTDNFNTSVSGVAQGNWYADLPILDITDTNADGWGDAGSKYPYNSTNTANFTGSGADNGPGPVGPPPPPAPNVSYGGGNQTTNITTYPNGSIINITNTTIYVSDGSILNMGWSKLLNYPSPCSAGSAVTGIGSSLTCNSFLQSFTETDPLWSGNSSTVARTGTCPPGQVVQNTTTGGVQCIAGSAGTVTQITAGNGLTGGVITTFGTIALNDTGASAGTYGGSNQTPILTIDSTGRITSVSNSTISLSDGSIANLSWDKLLNFPAACSAGNAITQVGISPVCSPFLTSFTETDPLWAGNASRVSDLETSNITTNSRIDTLNTSLSGRADRLENSNATAYSAIASVNATVNDLVSSNATTNARVSDLENSNATAYAAIASVNSTVNSLVSSNTTTNGRIDSVNTTVNDLVSSNTTTNARIDSVNTTVNSLVSSNTTTNDRIDTLNSSTSAAINSVNTTVNDLVSSNTTTNSRIDTLNATKVAISHGELFNSTANYSQTLPTRGNYQNITNWSAGLTSGWHYANDNKTLVSDTAGLYQVSAYLTFNASKADTYLFRTAQNNTPEPKSLYSATKTAATATAQNITIAFSYLQNFVANDNLTVQVADATASTSVITFYSKELLVTRAG